MKDRLLDYLRGDRILIDDIVSGSPFVRAVVAGLTLLIVTLLWLAANFLTTTQNGQIGLFAALTNILLTIGLLWIYLSIASAEKEQAALEDRQLALQKTQTDIIGAEFEPTLEVLEIATGPESGSQHPQYSRSGVDERSSSADSVRLTISNPSKAIAPNVRIRTAIDHDGLGGILSGTDAPVQRLGRKQTWTQAPGAIIRAEESEVEVEGAAKLLFSPRIPDQPFPLSSVLTEFIENFDVGHIRIGLSLVYDDEKGEEHQIELFGMDIAQPDELVGEELTIDEIRRRADPIPVAAVEGDYLLRGISLPPHLTRL